MRNNLLTPIVAVVVLNAITATHAVSQTGGKIWKEFVWLLRHDEFGAHRILPYDESLRSTLVGYLHAMREKADWREWEVEPEILVVDREYHCLVPLTFDSSRTTYCFTFLSGDGMWYLRHLQNLIVRLDTISRLPASSFPDLSEAQKAWVREENAWALRAKLFGALARAVGKDSALEQFKDGSAYLLNARSRVAVLPPWKAFILYLCWEQAQLSGSEVTLVALDDSEAVVHLTPIALLLHSRSGALSLQIGPDDQRSIFEAMWRDRAAAAGWQVDFTYQAEMCVMKFRRTTEPQTRE